MFNPSMIKTAFPLMLAFGLLFMENSHAETRPVPPGTITLQTPHPFERLAFRVKEAIRNHEMGLVAQASASRGAATLGVQIPGNLVLMVFRPDYALRMLEASIAAGIEAPLRLYLTENKDGTSNLTYRLPSAVFATYDHPQLDLMAAELDTVLRNIAEDSVRP